MAPNNKYGIWTEDQITLFTQIVSGRHFNCMPYHVSTKPDLPSVVGLFFNIPEQVIKDGNIVMQPGPKQISIHEYLIEKVGQENGEVFSSSLSVSLWFHLFYFRTTRWDDLNYA